MHIHEYQAKTLFSRNNIKTPKGVLIANTKEASKVCSELGGSI
ncbi:Succinyl-CoA ligase [ADP-forming] beta chain (EC, partial [uncultured Gammaproteobacteria bacterium]